MTDPRHLPSPDSRSVSVLLFGLPGTQKTSIAKAVADGLGWPVLLLSPGEFISRGLEYIEAQASSIFKRLLSLSQVVVLFDECDELFRIREPKAGVEQMRGIAAFVTAAMLPKLQALHDQGSVVFFICTNQNRSMDKAVKRGGRIDHIIAVPPPDREARLRIINDAIIREGLSIPSGIVNQVATSTDLFTITEVGRVAKAVSERISAFDDKKADDKKAEEKKAREALDVVEDMKKLCTIDSGENKLFVDDMKQESHAHLLRR